MWDLSSLTRDRTHAPAVGAQSNHWTTREVLFIHFIYSSEYLLTLLIYRSHPCFPFGNSVFCVLCLCFVNKFICIIFWISYISDVIRYLSFSVGFYLVWLSSSPSMLLQMAFFILFYNWKIFHFIYMPYLLYPFICWWAFRLFSYVL